MAKSIYPSEAKAILFLLTAHEELAGEVIRAFESTLGPANLQSSWHPFEQSSYYEKELGPSLKRCLVSFTNIFAPHRLPELKEIASDLELRTSNIEHRTINIDPGYVDLFKVVLASGKAGGQKIALAENVYAYSLLRYEKGRWLPFEWTYPDFKETTYHQDLLRIRENLRQELNKSKIK